MNKSVLLVAEGLENGEVEQFRDLRWIFLDGKLSYWIHEASMKGCFAVLIRDLEEFERENIRLNLNISRSKQS